MKKLFSLSAAQAFIGANDNAALIPEVWAMESLYQLQKASVMPWLVHRDYSSMVASYGETVNAHVPADFRLTRKGLDDNVETQDATATKVPVVLNQHFVISFVIKDGDESKAMTDLVNYYLVPAMRTMGEGIDQMLVGQAYNFIENSVGTVGSAPGKAALSKMQALLTNLKAPVADRWGVLSADTLAELNSVDALSDASAVGTTEVMFEGVLGRKYGTNWVSDIAVPAPIGATLNTNNAVNNVAGYPAGTTIIAFDGVGTPTTDSVVQINNIVYPVELVSGANMTLAYPLREAVANDDVIKHITNGTWGGTYAVGHVKEVNLGASTLSVGSGIWHAGKAYSIISLGSGANLYLLDRPLEDATTSGVTKFGIFPDADYNFVFNRNALAFVNRPLALPRTGALGAVAEENGVGVRVVITYDGLAQGHRVTIDLLAGVKVLNESLGAVLLS